MKILNLYSGPGSGKSTVASHVFAFLKRHAVKTELVGEFAKELIYDGSHHQLVNQVFIMGNQYKKLKDLERYGANLVISDSPLLLQQIYCKTQSYAKEIIPLLSKLNNEFENIDVFVRRTCKYQTFGRAQTEEEADILSKEIWDSMNGQFDYVIEGDLSGADLIAHEALKLADIDLQESLHLPIVPPSLYNP